MALGSRRAIAPRRQTPLATYAVRPSGFPFQEPSLDGTTLERPERDRIVLVELEGSRPGSVYSVRAPGALIGRAGSADPTLGGANVSWEHTRLTLGDVNVSWEHARLTLETDGAYIEDLSSRNGTVVNDRHVRQRTRLDDGDYLHLGGGSTVVKFSMMDEFEERALRALFELTLRDPLTCLYNRRYFDVCLSSAFACAQREGTPLALLLVDIDHFKRVNDTFGHPIGDLVIKQVAANIQGMLRPEDIVARYGGEEFIVIVRAMSWPDLEKLCLRVCQRIQRLSFRFTHHALSVTVSVGASGMGPGAPCASAEALLAAADQALYGSKTAGRNRASLRKPRPSEEPSRPHAMRVRTLAPGPRR